MHRECGGDAFPWPCPSMYGTLTIGPLGEHIGHACNIRICVHMYIQRWSNYYMCMHNCMGPWPLVHLVSMLGMPVKYVRPCFYTHTWCCRYECMNIHVLYIYTHKHTHTHTHTNMHISGVYARACMLTRIHTYIHTDQPSWSWRYHSSLICRRIHSTPLQAPRAPNLRPQWSKSATVVELCSRVYVRTQGIACQ